jgi:hypothetical protein
VFIEKLHSDCGRVVSPRTAASQFYGGVVWGLSHALREATEIDPRYGGYLNNDLADYVVPVNADIGEIDIGSPTRWPTLSAPRGWASFDGRHFGGGCQCDLPRDGQAVARSADPNRASAVSRSMPRFRAATPTHSHGQVHSASYKQPRRGRTV